MRRNVLGVGMAVVVCLIVVAGIGMPVAAATDLHITFNNLYTLNGFVDYQAYSSDMLLWTYGQNLNAAYEQSVGSYTQHADIYGYYWGECVSSVKALSNSNVATLNWTKGSLVVNGGVSAGTAIAKFESNNQYSQTGEGHAAIFRSYVYDGGGVITGFKVWDQGWYKVSGNGVFATHTLLRSGSGNADADNYYVIQIP